MSSESASCIGYTCIPNMNIVTCTDKMLAGKHRDRQADVKTDRKTQGKTLCHIRPEYKGPR